MVQHKDYSKTLNLPQTDFPMRGNLPQKEPLIIENWMNSKIYEKMRDKNKGNKKFVMVDGPPYANDPLHIGHVLNKVLKDIIIKYKNMKGFHAEFVPGWDCHGLPIEHKVIKALGKERQSKSKKEIRTLCRQEALKWVDSQKKQFIRWGILAEWDRPYLTLSPNYEAEEVREVGRILKNKVFYRGQKPVFWCPTLKTALADTEVEYKDHQSPSIYVRFEFTSESLKQLQLDSPASLVIWTTTPWTIPANYGVCFHPDFEYGVFDSDHGKLVLAVRLQSDFESQTGIQLSGPTKVLQGREFERLEAKHPFMDRKSLIILGTHVTLDAGTGCVHTAPAHGLDDYNVAIKYDLPVVSPVDEGGVYTSDFADMQGTHIFKANKILVERMKQSGHLVHESQLTHSYPHNWRSKTPLIYRATPQWFIGVDKESFNIRKKALKSIEEDIQFFPSWGKARLQSMVESRPDWCLSRQRIWGVPIPVFYCDSCGEALLNEEVIERIACKMEEGEGIEEYFEAPKGSFTQGFKCLSCGSQDFTASQDIMDVWFDSGVCHAAVQDKEDGLHTPADIYLEGSDQHRGWFQTSLLSSLASKGRPPYKALVTHGFVNDEKGHKMSKSLGNAIDPQKIIQQSGAEILRLWVSYEDYGQDVKVGPEIFKRVSETYRRIRNTMRFMLGVVPQVSKDQSLEDQLLDFKQLDVLDQWALHSFNQFIREVTGHYDDFSFYKVYHKVNQFFTVQLSATYLDIVKDRLYCDSSSSLKRRSSETAIYFIVQDMTKIIAPILSFLAEEVHDHGPLEKAQKAQSIWLESFPEFNSHWEFKQSFEDMEFLLDLRSKVTKKLENLRKSKEIGSSLEAQVHLSLEGKQFQRAKKYEAHLNELFIVSSVCLTEGSSVLEVSRFNGKKCERCWKFYLELYDDQSEICQRCHQVIS